MTLLAGLDTVLDELARLGVNASGYIECEDGRPGVVIAVTGVAYTAERAAFEDEAAALEFALVVAAHARAVSA